MNIRKSILCVSALIALFLAPLSAFAVVDTTSSELKTATNLVIPNGNSLPVLNGYSEFAFKSSTQISGGIVVNYEARLVSDPWFDSELPQIQLLIYSYASQESAESAFNEIVARDDFDNGEKSILESTVDTILYQTKEDGAYSDVFSTVISEYVSLHLVHKNGNLIFQSSLYRADGEFNSKNLQTYADAIADTTVAKSILETATEKSKTALAILFPPSDAEFKSSSESSSVNLSESYEIPSHGTVNLSVYVSDVNGATGTILDSSGISTAEEGDLYVYINGNGQILAGIYAPNFDADCDIDGGWYRLTSPESVTPYEWNDVALHYGVGGFSLGINGETVDSCTVSQPRSAKNLYLGDFPGDSIAESMIGYVDAITADYSLTDFGEKWDDVLTDQLFLDLPNTDADLAVFQYLKEEGVFMGSDGMLYPDRVLNRAEMVKIILKAFNRNPDAGNMVPFWDVPIDAWYRKYIAKAYDIGMVIGHSDLSFAPDAQINNAEFFTMLYRLRGSKRMDYDDAFTDVIEDDWYALGAEFAFENGLVSGDLFTPEETITRREAGKVLYILLKSI